MIENYYFIDKGNKHKPSNAPDMTKYNCDCFFVKKKNNIETTEIIILDKLLFGVVVLVLIVALIYFWLKKFVFPNNIFLIFFNFSKNFLFFFLQNINNRLIHLWQDGLKRLLQK